MLIMTAAAPTVTSLKNSVINVTVSNTPLPSTAGDWSEGQKLLAEDGATDEWFGCVSLSSDAAVIGARWDDDNGVDSGSAYVFTRTNTTWTQQVKLVAADGAAGDVFGGSVSLAGDNVIIGAYFDDDNGAESGSVYVFIRSRNTWIQQQKLLASDGAPGDNFGISVSVDGDTALIGAIYDDDNGINSGSAYVFTRSGNTWTQQAKLLPSDGVTDAQFGISVSLNGDTALIGANRDDDNGNRSGSAYVFTRTGNTWTLQAKLLSSDGEEFDLFGYSVSLDSDTALIGAIGDDDHGADSGSAYVFTRASTTWTQQQKLSASDGEAWDFFGNSVSLDGDTTLIGAYGADDYGVNSGSAYMYTCTANFCTQQTKILAVDSAEYDIFGGSVSLDGDYALIGAYLDDDNGADSGSAYVFTKLTENKPPLADFSWTPQNPNTNQQIIFDASSSHDSDRTIILYEWDWDNDGVYDDLHNSLTITHIWTNAGSYPVTLRVTDDENVTSTIKKTINVGGINLEIDIKGGLGVSMVITNTGTTDSRNVDWYIHVEGGILGRINITVNGTIDISAGESKMVGTGILFDFGPISITVKVASDEEQTVAGMQIIIFSMVKK